MNNTAKIEVLEVFSEKPNDFNHQQAAAKILAALPKGVASATLRKVFDAFMDNDLHVWSKLKRLKQPAFIVFAESLIHYVKQAKQEPTLYHLFLYYLIQKNPSQSYEQFQAAAQVIAYIESFSYLPLEEHKRKKLNLDKRFILPLVQTFKKYSFSRAHSYIVPYWSLLSVAMLMPDKAATDLLNYVWKHHQKISPDYLFLLQRQLQAYAVPFHKALAQKVMADHKRTYEQSESYAFLKMLDIQTPAISWRMSIQVGVNDKLFLHRDPANTHHVHVDIFGGQGEDWKLSFYWKSNVPQPYETEIHYYAGEDNEDTKFNVPSLKKLVDLKKWLRQVAQGNNIKWDYAHMFVGTSNMPKVNSKILKKKIRHWLEQD